MASLQTAIGLAHGRPSNALIWGTVRSHCKPITNKYVCAVDGGGGAVVADRNAVNAWETFGLTQVSLSFAQSDENLTIENGKASISEGEGSVCASC